MDNDTTRKIARERLANTGPRGSNKRSPDLLNQEAKVRGTFASQERQQFFDEAYGNLLVDYFIEWLKTEPSDFTQRDFIYNSAKGLADVQNRLVQFEQLGLNADFKEVNK